MKRHTRRNSIQLPRLLVVLLASLIGCGLLRGSLMYGDFLVEALNHNIDAVYQEAGVPPTRDLREAERLSLKMEAYRKVTKGGKIDAEELRNLAERYQAASGGSHDDLRY